MAYVALYRKWRSKTFDDVVGQQHITTTLKNQIMDNRIAHAYLFSGTRGTGKTSTAKIFAKAVNCKDLSTASPCNECESCISIDSGNNMDIIEIDAASNNSVDDVRELRDKVKYPPSKGKYKVYIIDEVHMLSTGAFNALLKTLEEPPAHAIFILATTEPHKLPATIISRCQRFDFKRIGHQDMIKRLEYICDNSNINIEKQALEIIVNNADGAMRDALSILDQCSSVVSHTITAQDINNILGIVNSDFIGDFGQALIDRNIIKLLDYIEELYNSGKDIQNFVKELIAYFRNKMLEQLNNNPKSSKLNRILDIINNLSSLEGQLKWSTQPRISLETSMVKLSTLDNLSIIERLEELEGIVKGNRIYIQPQHKEDINNEVVRQPKAEDKPNIIKDKDQSQVMGEASTPLIVQKDDEHKVEQKSSEGSKEEVQVNLEATWKKLLSELKAQHGYKAVYTFLEKAIPVELKGATLVVGFEDPTFAFNIAFLETGKNIQIVEQIFSKLINKSIKVQYKIIEEQKKDDKSKGAKDKQDLDVVDHIVKSFGKDKVEIFD